MTANSRFSSYKLSHLDTVAVLGMGPGGHGPQALRFIKIKRPEQNKEKCKIPYRNHQSRSNRGVRHDWIELLGTSDIQRIVFKNLSWFLGF